MMEIFLALAALILLGLFIYRPKVGLYLMALTLPVIGFDLKFFGLEIPPIDFIALLLFFAFAFKTLYSLLFKPNEKLKIKWPLFLPFILFLGISFLSSIFSGNPYYSLWYFCRWPLFLYLAYVFLPYNLIRDQKTLKKVIIAATASSLVVLFFGFLSLYGQDWRDSFFRIRSLSLGGIFPFGENHNLIAEFLNFGVFFILSLRILAKDKRFKRFLDIAFFLSVLGIIMTFSRSGWIILAAQSLVYIGLYFRDKKVKARELIVAGLLLIILVSPLFIKMTRLQAENVSSTENRWLLTEISLEAFSEKPILGYGSGYFIRLVESNVRFRAKYGAPIDSHGVLQKVLAENGLLGLLAYIFLLLVLLKTFYLALKKYHHKFPWLAPLIIGATGSLFFQFLNTSYYKGKVWLPIVLVLLSIKLLETNEKNETGKK